ncbi:MAG: methyltransferase [Alphaproteobacteria bacterium]|nr:methyltransferase [Alphaproteobacteria bacterium]
MHEETFTQDYLLNGRIMLRQPVNGYRVAIDPVFLAAAVDAKEGESILDIGAGVGAASLCLAVRQPQCKIVGLEVQRDYVRLAAQNIELNNLRDRVEMLHGDLLRPPPRLAAGTFSHVMTNPPYLESHRGKSSPHADKNKANQETDVDLESWARFCLLMVKPKGTVTFIHRADRLDHIMAYFAGKLGNITIYPLWPGKGKSAKRVIVSGIKNMNGALKLSQGMFLHEADGRFTRDAESVLRDGEKVEL